MICYSPNSLILLQFIFYYLLYVLIFRNIPTTGSFGSVTLECVDENIVDCSAEIKGDVTQSFQTYAPMLDVLQDVCSGM